ncbi:unnamed protein product [Aphanomyces euteiches]
MLKAWMLIIVALVSPMVVTVDAQLKRCDASKIALATYPAVNSPAGKACGADALGGRPISSIFEAVISDATIAKMVAAPSCQAWWSALAQAFTSLSSCTFLGKNVQDFGSLSLEAFLHTNNKEIQSFDPSKPFDPSQITWDPPSNTATPSTSPAPSAVTPETTLTPSTTPYVSPTDTPPSTAPPATSPVTTTTAPSPSSDLNTGGSPSATSNGFVHSVSSVLFLMQVVYSVV